MVMVALFTVKCIFLSREDLLCKFIHVSKSAIFFVMNLQGGSIVDLDGVGNDASNSGMLC